MFDPLTLALISSGVGALANKKDRLKGAAIGAGIGTGGSFLLGGGMPGAGLLGGEVPDGSSLVDLTGSPLEALTKTQQPGGGLLDTVKEYSPALSAASTGLQIGNSLMPQAKPIEHAQMPQSMGGGDTLAGLFASLEQKKQQEMEAARRRRMPYGGYA